MLWEALGFLLAEVVASLQVKSCGADFLGPPGPALVLLHTGPRSALRALGAASERPASGPGARVRQPLGAAYQWEVGALGSGAGICLRQELHLPAARVLVSPHTLPAQSWAGSFALPLGPQIQPEQLGEGPGSCFLMASGASPSAGTMELG